MKLHNHIKILEFALTSLLRKKTRNLVIILAYILNVFIFSSAMFYSESLKKESVELLQGSPELIVQRMKGGRHELIPLQYAEEIMKIRGTTEIVPRYWGYYYDPPVNSNYTFLGADQMGPEISAMVEGSFFNPGDSNSCVIGEGIAEARYIGVDDIIPVKGADGQLHVLRVAGIFNSESAILTNDLVVLSPGDIKRIFAIPDNMATDLVVNVLNPSEVSTVAGKILEKLPDTRPIEKSQIIKTYEALFSWRSGLVVTIFIGAIVAFSILAWDKATGLSGEERREIGILKAIGWETSDILALKFWEGFTISVVSFLSGIIAAHAHIFLFKGLLFAPVMRGWSSLFPPLNLAPQVDFYQIIIVAFLTVIPYITATIVPSWKVAITDPDMVMRG